MTNYSEKSSDCEVNVFQPRDNGMKWRATFALSFEGLYDEVNASTAFRKALQRHEALVTDRQPSGKATPREGNEDQLRNFHAGMYAVCLDPCHRSSHPVCILIPDQWDSEEKGN